jgi:transposase InsO family protein
MEHYGTPAIFHSDQGSQFTANRLTGCLKQAGVMLISGV